MKQAEFLAKNHATGEIPDKGDGYEVVACSVGDSVFGSVNENGTEVGKRRKPVEKQMRSVGTRETRGRKRRRV